jgi:hypothetical protein
MINWSLYSLILIYIYDKAMRKIGDQPIYQGFQGMDSVGFTKSSHYRIIADFLQGQSDLGGIN